MAARSGHANWGGGGRCFGGSWGGLNAMGTSTSYGLPTTGNWPKFKRLITAYAKLGEGIEGGISSVISEYVRAYGGAARAAEQMTGSIRTGANLGSFLTNVQTSGLRQALIDAGLSHL